MPDLDVLRIERLRRTLAAVSAAHPFYRARFQALKINARDTIMSAPSRPSASSICASELNEGTVAMP
jgi:hypothetical protein